MYPSETTSHDAEVYRGNTEQSVRFLWRWERGAMHTSVGVCIDLTGKEGLLKE